MFNNIIVGKGIQHTFIKRIDEIRTDLEWNLNRDHG
jgi:hypothetical protein